MISKETMQILSKIKGFPDLSATITGQNINGNAYFYGTKFGVVCVFDIFGLPSGQFLGLHIHEGDTCDNNGDFASAGEHLNLTDTQHPNHTGDLPCVYTNNGHTLMAVLIDKFTLNDIKNRTIIVHSQPDNFTTQPSGNSGSRIACGVIK